MISLFSGNMLTYSGFPRSWKKPGKFWKKKLFWKVIENLQKIGSHEILLRAERKFLKKLLVIPVAVT